jgi:IclR family acetate operon transcriptional repressor
LKKRRRNRNIPAMTDQNTPKRPRGRPRLNRPAQSSDTVRTLDRALDLITLLAQSDEGETLTALADKAGMAAATVYRLLSTMEARGFVAHDEREGRWRIGVETFRAGAAFVRATKLAEIGRAVMRELMEKADETVNLAIEQDGDVVFISQAESHQAIRAFFRPGTRAPMHASGIGKVLMAYLPDKRLQQIVDKRGLEGFTPKTITARDRLGEALGEIRARGWALDDEERNQGMRCVAAPIFNEYGDAIAGISVSGPAVRLPDDKLDEVAREVKAAAAAITRSIAGVAPNAAPS